MVEAVKDAAEPKISEDEIVLLDDRTRPFTLPLSFLTTFATLLFATCHVHMFQ